jgi:hypothetical protein
VVAATLGLLAGGLAAGAGAAAAAGPYLVTSEADSGPGSLREGLATSSDIRIANSVERIQIASTLVYDREQPLRIRGNGAEVDGDGLGETLLRIESTTAVEIRHLGFDDGGDYGLDSFDEGDPIYGIHIVVPASATGTVAVTLRQVAVEGTAGHGVFLDDNLASPASVSLDARDVQVEEAGIGAFDQDGIRVDEVGEGDLVLAVQRSTFVAVGADGVEVDERGAGDVIFDVRTATFERNGDYCVPEPLPLDEARPCVEDGELDLDDGFDIDEADDGSILGTLAAAELVDNFDEGFDVDEAGEGGVEVDIRDVDGAGNTDESIKISEEDDGDVLAGLRRVAANASVDGDGIEIEEEGDGSTIVAVRDSVVDDNGGDGLKLEEADDGDLTVELRKIEVLRNGDDGVVLSESDEDDPTDGVLSGEIRDSRIADNGDVQLVEEGGTVTLRKVSFV